VSKGMVEKVGDIGGAGSKEGVGEVNVGTTTAEFARKGLTIKFTGYNIASFKDILARLPRRNKRKAGNFMCL
jgi:hypothetical protein